MISKRDWVFGEDNGTPYIATDAGADVGIRGQYSADAKKAQAVLNEIVATRNACKGLGHPEAIAPLVKQLKHCLEHGFTEHDKVTLQALVSHLENGG